MKSNTKSRGGSIEKNMFLIVVSILMASSMEIIMKLFALQLNPIEMNFWRFALGAFALAPFAIPKLVKRKKAILRSDFALLSLSGFVCVVLSTSLYQTAILFGKASVVAILFCCNYLFSIPLSILILKEKACKGTLLSIIICTLGIVFIVIGQDSANNFASCFLVLVSGLFYAIYLIISKECAKRFHPVSFTFISFVFGCIELLVLIFITNIPFVAQFFKGLGLGILANIPIFESALWINW